LKVLTEQDITLNVPGIFMITLPITFFYEISDSKSVFESFYDVIPYDLRNRTYVCMSIFSDLKKAESSRLRKLHGWTGGKLARAVKWSDAHPLTEMGRLKIEGDKVFVVNDACLSAFEKFNMAVSQRGLQFGTIKLKSAGINLDISEVP